jgi:hypothetical protein
MHGRVKVKTTEQQEREKKLERDAKLASYRKVGTVPVVKDYIYSKEVSRYIQRGRGIEVRNTIY